MMNVLDEQLRVGVGWQRLEPRLLERMVEKVGSFALVIDAGQVPVNT